MMMVRVSWPIQSSLALVLARISFVDQTCIGESMNIFPMTFTCTSVEVSLSLWACITILVCSD
jgi:hypothetical protein